MSIPNRFARAARPASTAAVVIAALAVLIAAPAAAQSITGLPQPSPHARAEQTVGITEIAVDYHRPAVRERAIWDAVVPYGQVWRAGANLNTVISFSHPVTIEGQALAAGTYGFHTLPTAGDWTLIFSTNSTSWGSFTYDQAEDALRVTVTPRKAAFAESLSYRFEDVGNDSATAVLHWAELEVPFKIATDTHANTLVYLRQQLRDLPRFFWQGWSSAATYCLQNDFNHEEALGWIDHSIGLNRNPTNLLVKAALLRQVGRNEEAEEIVEGALVGADEAGTNNIGYVFLQGGQTERAIEIFTKNTENHPESWNVWDSLGEAYAGKGDTQAAITNYTKALELAQDPQQKARIEGVLKALKSGK